MKKAILIASIVTLLLVAGCSSFDDCMDTCYKTKIGNLCDRDSYIFKYEHDCIVDMSQALEKICYEECKT